MGLADFWPFGRRRVPAPERQRKEPRISAATGEYSRAFMAASPDRLVADMPTFPRSYNFDLQRSLRIMRARSRHLFENSDYAKNYGRVLKRNVVGAQGIRLQARVPTQNGTLDELANRIIEGRFAEWSRKGVCTLDGRLSFAQLQALCVLQTARDGETLLQRIRRADNPFGYALHPLPVDKLDENLNVTVDASSAGVVKKDTGTEIRMGVERVFGRNEPVAYHLLTVNPADEPRSYRYNNRKYERLPAAEILHLYIQEDADQVRGLPWAHTAIRRLQILSGYEEAELTAARAASSKMGFYKEIEVDADSQGEEKNAAGEPIQDFEPAHFERLPKGLEFQGFDPQHPTTQFGEFIKHVLRGGSAGLGISYHSASNDLSDANYSSLRQGALDEQYEFEMLQKWLSEGLCDPVYRDWLDLALIKDVLKPLRFSSYDRYTAVQWQPRGFSWVDPEKEAKAIEKALELKITTRTQACSERGLDFEEVLQQLQAEEKLAAKYGIDLAPAKKPAAPAAPADPAATD